MKLKFPSAYDKLMKELEEKGQVSIWEHEKSVQLQQEISEEMSGFYIEKQRRTAESEKHAAEIILNA